VTRCVYTLWDGDSDLNPKRKPVTDLELVYGSGLVQVAPPVGAELEGLRTELNNRTEAIRKDLALGTVPARPSRSNCGHCQVKLLCDRFWSDVNALGSDSGALSNVIVLTEESRSENTWFARITSSDGILDSGRVVLRQFEGGNEFWSKIEPGIEMRLTDVQVSLRDKEELPLISLTMLSEALFCQ
jgi:hypothetical protein